MTVIHRRAAAALADKQQRIILTRALGLLRRWRAAAFPAPDTFHDMQAVAGEIRRRALADLPALLAQLETQVTARGGIVHWAEDAAAANAYVLSLAQQQAAGTVLGQRQRPCRVVKTASILSAEIGLEAALQAAGAEVTDLPLGDYINQLAGESGSHPVFAALHRRKEDVAALFGAKLDMPETLDPQAMASMARYKQRRVLLQADMAIAEVTLAVAETGTLALATPSGAERLAMSLAPVQVILMGIGDVVARLDELFVLLTALARSAVGQSLPHSVTLLNGPAQNHSLAGPRQLYLIIVDNGRSELLGQGYGEALACIRCGACMNVCPVYQEIGGQAYGGALGGPIGAVMIPLLPAPFAPQTTFTRLPLPARWQPQRNPAQEHQSSAPGVSHLPASRTTARSPLPWASTLCGACAEVCPVGIDIPRLLLQLRETEEITRLPSIASRTALRLWVWTATDARRYRLLARGLAKGSGVFGRRQALPTVSTEANDRDLPTQVSGTFREWWQKRKR